MQHRLLVQTWDLKAVASLKAFFPFKCSKQNMEQMFLEMFVKVLAFIQIPDNATGHIMLTKIINFHGVC